jgi:Raf kinase inhibitor-like YbhB/YbcL family protein
MILKSESFREGAAIPGEFAFAVIDPKNHVALSKNRNPQLTWSDAPAGTRSFAVVMHDPDVPSKGDDVNKEGREIPASLPRIDFFHWVLMDIPPTAREIGAGTHSDRVTPRGKSGPSTSGGLRHGINDYTNWFAADSEMRGKYYGYDGPAPPWNDSIVHRYVFTLYALDVARLDVSGDLNGPNVMNALTGHVLAKATLTGIYSLNPRLASTQ